MVSIVFEEKQYLLLLFLVPIFVLFYFFLLRKIKSEALMFANYEALERIKNGITSKAKTNWKDYIFNKEVGQVVLKAATLTLLIVALAQPVLYVEGAFQQYNYVVVIDGSYSMLTEDIKPTRFTAAKDAARLLIEDSYNETNVGVVVFSSEAFIIKGMEDEIEDLDLFFETVEPPAIGETNIAKGLIISTNMLLTLDTDFRAQNTIVLVTDGDDTITDEKTKAELVNYMQQNDISVIAIGVGTEDSDQLTDSPDHTLLELNEGYLEGLAEQTDGDYFRVKDGNRLTEVITELTSKERVERPILIGNYLSYFVVALLLFLWTFVSSRYRSVP